MPLLIFIVDRSGEGARCVSDQGKTRKQHTHTRTFTHVCAEDRSDGLEALVPQVAGGSDR